MSAPCPVRGKKSNQIIWKQTREHFNKCMVNQHFNNMGSFCSLTFEKMKQT